MNLLYYRSKLLKKKELLYSILDTWLHFFTFKREISVSVGVRVFTAQLVN